MARLASHHGALIIDKPRGLTSHDLVSRARRLYGQKQVGHGGTLDPLATGVLVLLLGEGTKLSRFVTGAEKEYEATVSFGASTTTLDAQGTIVDQQKLGDAWLSASRLEQAVAVERDRQLQVPPEFSAIKVAGRAAHYLARRGEAVELSSREVKVHSLALLDWDQKEANFRLVVSKGYYVRSFARDLALSLEVPGHLTALRRTRSGRFSLADATPLGPSPSPLLTIREVAERCMSVVELTQEGAEKARQGRPLSSEHFLTTPKSPEPTAWLDGAGELVAVGALAPQEISVEESLAPPTFRVLRGFLPPVPAKSLASAELGS